MVSVLLRVHAVRIADTSDGLELTYEPLESGQVALRHPMATRLFSRSLRLYLHLVSLAVSG